MTTKHKLSSVWSCCAGIRLTEGVLRYMPDTTGKRCAMCFTTLYVTVEHCYVPMMLVEEWSLPLHLLPCRSIPLPSPLSKSSNPKESITLILEACIIVANGRKLTLVSYFLISSPPSFCSLLCKLSGVFVTAWRWQKRRQAELWIANVPWGGRPWFDILNKLQLRQAGNSSTTAYYSSGSLWDMGKVCTLCQWEYMCVCVCVCVCSCAHVSEGIVVFLCWWAGLSVHLGELEIC